MLQKSDIYNPDNVELNINLCEVLNDINGFV